jgi:glyoxylase-like metal-dependent hydrolase (beta-lactamase superfamily II)
VAAEEESGVLERLSDRVLVLPGGVNVGVVQVDDKRCVLIDAGLNDTAARRALKAVREELDSEIVTIVTTHGHADHFGGNAFIVKRTGAKVYAPALDEAILRYPILQPAMLYGGADPLESMRTNFMLADASPVDQVYDDEPIEIDGLSLGVVPLAGHSANQKGILVDDVFFAADVVLPETVLEKYRIPYLYSLTDHLASLERCAGVTARTVVAGHGPILESIVDLRDRNRQVVLETLEAICQYAVEPRTSGAIMKHVLDARGANVGDSPGYYLLQPTIAAYLTHLTRIGELTHLVESNSSTWLRT